jgi:hypothetical protein
LTAKSKIGAIASLATPLGKQSPITRIKLRIFLLRREEDTKFFSGKSGEMLVLFGLCLRLCLTWSQETVCGKLYTRMLLDFVRVKLGAGIAADHASASKLSDPKR